MLVKAGASTFAGGSGAAQAVGQLFLNRAAGPQGPWALSTVVPAFEITMTEVAGPESLCWSLFPKPLACVGFSWEEGVRARGQLCGQGGLAGLCAGAREQDPLPHHCPGEAASCPGWGGRHRLGYQEAITEKGSSVCRMRISVHLGPMEEG